MTCRELIALLKKQPPNRDVMLVADEFCTYHDLRPHVVDVVQVNGWVGGGSKDWIEKDFMVGRKKVYAKKTVLSL